MTIHIQGYFNIVFYKNNKEVSELEEANILTKLQQGEYTIGMESRNLFNENYQVIGYFELSPTENTEYNFES